MKRFVVCLAIVNLWGSPSHCLGESIPAPQGYRFFSRRVRTAQAAANRIVEYAAPRADSNRKLQRAAHTQSEPSGASAGAPLQPQPQGPPPATAVVYPDYSANNGFGYYFPGTTWVGSDYTAFNYGVPLDWPPCGWRSAHRWCGHRCSSHCFRSCDWNAAGPHYDCGYRPGWNDCGPTVFECRNKRGSALDCLWQMGGWDCHHSPSCCTYPCGPGYCWPGMVRSTTATPSQKVSTNFYNYGANPVSPVPNEPYYPNYFRPDQPVQAPVVPQPAPDEPRPQPEI